MGIFRKTASTSNKEDAPEREEHKSFVTTLRQKLSKTRTKIAQEVDRILPLGKKIDEDLLDELEEMLIEADLGVSFSEKMIEDIRKNTRENRLKEANEVRKYIKGKLTEVLKTAEIPLEINSKPFVIMVIGVNGVGKTTTIAKLAHKFKSRNLSILLAGCDTFRAAAMEQLDIWAHRLGVDIIKSAPGGDPTAVAYDALKACIARNMDVLIIDTAGRLHTRVNLMQELKKMKRVLEKELPGAPHEILLILDATTGQNAVQQVKEFNSSLNITGLALTKVDGTAKGGIIVAIADLFNIPLRYIGIGEKKEELKEFEAAAFIDAIFDNNRHQAHRNK